MKTQKKGTIDIIMPDGEIVEWSAIASGIDGGTSPDDVQQMIDESIVDKANLVNGVVPEQELPSYVDDVVEYSSQSAFPQQGDIGKIYVALDTGLIYRWSGSQYVQIAAQDNVVEVADYASLPTTGQAKVIYITKDTNKQYRWDATNGYVELSPEEEIELITINNSTLIAATLTPEQVKKAMNGKVIFTEGMGDILIPYGIENGFVLFVGIGTAMEWHYMSADYVPIGTDFTRLKARLNISTGEVTIYGSKENFVVTLTSSNFFDATTIPESSGKRIVREMNLHKTQDMITPNVYSASSTYAVGDYVIYQNQLYRCITSITVAEAWNASHWLLVDVSEELKTKQNILSMATNAEVRLALNYTTPVYLEYIEGTGTQYAITDYTLTKNSKIDCILESTGGQSGYFRYFGTDSSLRMFLENQSGSNNYRLCVPSISDTNICERVDNSKVHIVLSPTSTVISNEDDTIVYGSKSYSASANINTGKLQIMNAGGNPAMMRLYAFKVYESNVLSADFKPATFKGRTGLYEVISQTFYTSANEFIAGPFIIEE